MLVFTSTTSILHETTPPKNTNFIIIMASNDSSSALTDQNVKSRLLRLPAELRNQIFAVALYEEGGSLFVDVRRETCYFQLHDDFTLDPKGPPANSLRLVVASYAEKRQA